MADDYYPADAEDAASSDKGGGKPDSGMDSMGTCLVPRSMFQGKSIKPGDEFIFKVVHEYGDEIEVEYSTGEEKKEPERGMESEGSSPMAAFDDKFSGEKMMGGE